MVKNKRITDLIRVSKKARLLNYELQRKHPGLKLTSDTPPHIWKILEELSSKLSSSERSNRTIHYLVIVAGLINSKLEERNFYASELATAHVEIIAEDQALKKEFIARQRINDLLQRLKDVDILIMGPKISIDKSTKKVSRSHVYSLTDTWRDQLNKLIDYLDLPVETNDAVPGDTSDQLIRDYYQRVKKKIIAYYSDYRAEGGVIIEEQGIKLRHLEKEGDWGPPVTNDRQRWTDVEIEEVRLGLERGNRFLLEGEMGLGKTTLLIKLLDRQVDRFINGEHVKLPFYVPLRELGAEQLREQKGETLLEKLLIATVKSIYGMERAPIGDWQKIIPLLVTNGGIFLLLDGLDEFTLSTGGQLLDPLDLLTSSVSAGVILSARPHQAREAAKRLGTGLLATGACKYLKLEYFTDEQVVEYLEGSISKLEGYENHEQLFKALEKHFSGRKSPEGEVSAPYYSIPLFLWSITLYFKVNNGEFPSVEDIFEEVFRVQYDWFLTKFTSKYRISKKKKILDLCRTSSEAIEFECKEKSITIRTDIFCRFLRESCSQLSLLIMHKYMEAIEQEQQAILEIPLEDYVFIIETVSQRYLPYREQFKQLLWFVLENSSEFLVAISSTARVRITQVRMLEYFCTKTLIDEPEVNQDLIGFIIGNLTLNPCRNIVSLYQDFLTSKEKEIPGKLAQEIRKLIVDHLPEDGTVLQVLYDRYFTNEPETFLTAVNTAKHRITSIDLSNKQLKQVPESFGNLSELQHLELHWNKLKTLPESFGELSNLQTLRLNYNKLTTLPESFGQLRNLETLYLFNNQLRTLPESFGELSNLQTLRLNYNELTTLPESFGNLTKLEYLDLRWNLLSTLPESFGNLSKLHHLGLHWNKLKTLPESFGKLSNLQNLNLTWNGLTTLPESFGNLTKLTYINFWGNKLTTFPESLGNLTKLERLNLMDNELVTLPELFGKLRNLQELDLYENQLKILPDSFGNLTKLQELYLGNNQLKTLPDSFGNLTKLQEVHLDENQLKTLPDSFGKLSNLQNLNLSWNKLTTLPESFGQLRNLETLYLFYNQLENLPNSFKDLSNLTYLGLKNKQLDYRSQNLVKYLENKGCIVDLRSVIYR
ncbi:MAG: leucine-rich repeat domain-containing protein [Candidatus Hodarchaeales archaeon]|jgi:Leucine-rich repeat (LRR) protein